MIKTNAILVLGGVAVLLGGSVSAQAAEDEGTVSGEQAVVAESKQPKASSESSNAGTIEEVIVTGVPNINRSVGELKQHAVGVSDSLNYEAINLFPEDSIGGVLDKVVGANAIVDPTSGQPRFISLRGFGPQYNSLDFDGITILNSSANNRGVRLDIFPTSLLHEINFFKTTTADMDGNSIGGHVSVRTLRAFDNGGKPFLNAKLQVAKYEHDNEPDDNEPSYRGDAVGKFTFGSEDQFGAVFGIDVQNHEYSQDSQRFNDGYRVVNGLDVPERDTIFNQIVFQTDIDRIAGFGKFEVQATNDLYAFASLHYFNQDEVESRNRTGHFVDPAEAISTVPGEVTYSETQAIASFVDRERNRETMLGSLGADFVTGDLSSLSVRASYSEVTLDSSFNQSKSFVSRANNSDPLSTADDLTVRFDDTDIDVTLGDPNNFSDPGLFRQEGNGATFNQQDGVDDKLAALRADYSFNVHPDAEGFGFKTGVGGQRINREFDREVLRYRLSAADQTAYTLEVNNPSLGSTVSTLDNIFIDRDAYWNTVINNNVNTGTETRDSFRPDVFNFQADYDLLEDVMSTYGMASYAGYDYRIVAGLRYEHTSSENTGYSVEELPGGVGTIVTPDRVTNSYANFLPSLLISYSPTNSMTLRAGYTRTLSRPDFQHFAVRSSTEVLDQDNSLVLERFIGDPKLEARVADGIDFSGEYYFQGYDGFASVGLFYKRIHDEIYEQVSTVVEPGSPIPVELTQAKDDSSVRVNGIELNFVMNSLDFLPSPWNRFGVQFNYTYTDAEWEFEEASGATRTVQGFRSQSDQLANLLIRYRWNNLGINLSIAKRGEYLRRLGETVADDVYVAELTRVTLSSFYRVTDEFSVHFDVRNVNSPAYEEVTGINRNLILRSIEPAPSYWLAVKYRL